MANTNAPFGFRPLRSTEGGEIVLEEFTIASNYATKIYTNDVVELTGTGKNIQRAAAANVDNLGIFQGVYYIDSQGKPVFSRYWPGNVGATNARALVVASPAVVFEVECDSLAEADVGTLMDQDAGTGSDSTGYSSVSLSNASKATTDKTFRVIGLTRVPGNEYGSYAKAEVMFAEHIRLNVVAGVGGI